MKKVNGVQAAVSTVAGSATVFPVFEPDVNPALEMFSAADVALELPADGSIVVQVDASQSAMIGTGYTNRLGEVYGKVTGLLNLNLASKVMRTVKETGEKVAKLFGSEQLPHWRIRIEHEPDTASDAGKRAVVVVPATYTYPSGHAARAGQTVSMFFKVMRQVQTVELEPLTFNEHAEYLKAQSIKGKIAKKQ